MPGHDGEILYFQERRSILPRRVRRRLCSFGARVELSSGTLRRSCRDVRGAARLPLRT